jgi:hypothetical protein
MEDLIQSELDIAEEYILTQIFGSIDNVKLSGVANWLFTQISKGKNFEDFINENIQKFELLAKGFITETGYINGNLLTEFLVKKAPILNGCINLPTLKPIDYAKLLDGIINFQALGILIKSL